MKNIRTIALAAALLALTPFITAASLGQPTATPVPNATNKYFNLTGCVNSHLQLAPQLSTDFNDKHAPVQVTPEDNYTYTPVIVVHGWTGTDVHDTTRKGAFSDFAKLEPDDFSYPNSMEPTAASVIGNLQNVRGVAVYTFDYKQTQPGPFTARWVDDPQIGPELRKDINCLAAKTHQPVMAVAHSMGGLALRYAMADPATAKNVSDVYTLGTPNNGANVQFGTDTISYVAALASGSSCGIKVTLLSSNECNYQNPYDTGVANFIDITQRYTTLKTWQHIKATAPNFELHAYAGDITTTMNTSLFGLFPETNTYNIGDSIVPTDSALAQTGPKDAPYTSGITAKCAYTLNYFLRGKFTFDGKTREGQNERFLTADLGTIAAEGGSACTHMNEPRNAAIATDIAASIDNKINNYQDLDFSHWDLTAKNVGPLNIGDPYATMMQYFGPTDSEKQEQVKADNFYVHAGWSQSVAIRAYMKNSKANEYVISAAKYTTNATEKANRAKAAHLFPKTAKGITIGSSLSATLKAYPGTVKKDKNVPNYGVLSVDAGGGYLNFTLNLKSNDVVAIAAGIKDTRPYTSFGG